jgi:hypothetical protein
MPSAKLPAVTNWTIELGKLALELPPAVKAALQTALVEIAAVVDELPRDGMARSALRGEQMHLQLLGWRFAYIVQMEARELRVIGASSRQ